MACLLHKVLGILRQTLEVFVSRLRLHLLTLTKLLDGLDSLVLRHAGVLEDAACRGVYLQQGEQNGLNTCKLVAILLCEVLRTLQDAVGVVAEVWLPALHTRQTLNLRVDHHVHLIGIHTELLEDVRGNVLGLHHHTLEEVYWLNALLSMTLCNVDSLLNNLLGFDCEFVECHIIVLLSLFFLFYIVFIVNINKLHT